MRLEMLILILFLISERRQLVRVLSEELQTVKNASFEEMLLEVLEPDLLLLFNLMEREWLATTREQLLSMISLS